MGGFSDNYECGYWGDEAPPMSKRQDKNFTRNKKTYVEKISAKFKYLTVLLSSENLLTSSEQESRANLCQTWDEDILLELRHNRDNKDDNKKLDVYYESIFIGSIQKVFTEENIDNRTVVDDFCFINSELKEIQLFWDDENFYLKQEKCKI